MVWESGRNSLCRGKNDGQNTDGHKIRLGRRRQPFRMHQEIIEFVVFSRSPSVTVCNAVRSLVHAGREATSGTSMSTSLLLLVLPSPKHLDSFQLYAATEALSELEANPSFLT